MMSIARRRLASWVGCVLALVFSASAASAETLLMPPRDYLMGANEVVWGITTQPNGTAFEINFGDGSPVVSGNVVDRSYITSNHIFGAPGTFTVTLRVGVGPAQETATVVVRVFDGSVLSAFNLRALNKNRAIQNGLRYLWFAQVNRTTFDTTATTNWGGSHPDSHAALITLAFENHGYVVPTDNSTPVGIYPKYLVQRGLNHVFNNLAQITLTAQPAGDPCAGVSDAPAPCIGLFEPNENPGYSTAVLSLPIAASGALGRVVSGIPGTASAGFVVGKTYREILQRTIDALAFGQNEDPTFNGRGGWVYGFNSTTSDGSTLGWDVLAFLDSDAAGGIVRPAFVVPELRDFAYPRGLNNDGSFDYRADNNPAANERVNLAKAAIGLQAAFLLDIPEGDPRVQNALDYISDRWNSNALGQAFHCTNGTTNKGCAYGMFNAFKGLKLYGVETLPGVGRPAGPGTIPANDWHADLEDYLVANQQAPLATTGGHWGNGTPVSFSCCEFGTLTNVVAAMAELILAPVALVPPDPGLFRTVGLAPATATNPPGTSHTVTATALSASKTPVPGVTITFEVLTGPNAGKTGTDVTDADGKATFTYTDTSAPPHGTDTIQAFIGTLGSNVVSKTWAVGVTTCDIDADGDVDLSDLALIRAANGTKLAPGATDARDANGDRRINVADVRFCTLRCTRAGCAR